MSHFSFNGDTLYRYSPSGVIDLFNIHPPDSLRGYILSQDTGCKEVCQERLIVIIGKRAHNMDFV